MSLVALVAHQGGESAQTTGSREITVRWLNARQAVTGARKPAAVSVSLRGGGEQTLVTLGLAEAEVLASMLADGVRAARSSPVVLEAPKGREGIIYGPLTPLRARDSIEGGK